MEIENSYFLKESDILWRINKILHREVLQEN